MEVWNTVGISFNFIFLIISYPLFSKNSLIPEISAEVKAILETLDILLHCN